MVSLARQNKNLTPFPCARLYSLNFEVTLMRTKYPLLIIVVAIVLSPGMFPVPSFSQAVFYQGKTLKIINNDPGGVVSLRVKTVIKYLSKYIPGESDYYCGNHGRWRRPQGGQLRIPKRQCYLPVRPAQSSSQSFTNLGWISTSILGSLNAVSLPTILSGKGTNSLSRRSLCTGMAFSAAN